jgi:peptide/nickel transport system substrate-binding protein
MHWRFAIMALALALGIAVPRAGAESVLRVSANTPVRSLDPAKYNLGAIEYNYSLLVYSRLTYFDDKLNVIPDLAESWESTPDQKVWTFHLRKGVKFHDGREVDADDVVATYKRIADPANGSVIRASVRLAQNIEAVDKYTVRFTLSTPYSVWPAITAAFQTAILPRDKLDTITTEPIGSGPYKFVSYDPNGAMELTKNSDYFEPGLPKLDRIEFRIIPDFSTAVAALERGELDLVWGLPPEFADKLAKSTVAHVDEVPTGTWEMFSMNEQIPPFENPKVRQAMFKLVDRQTITDVALFGHGTPTISPIPPFHPFYDHAIPIGKADPEAAKKLLAEAGFPNGITVALWMPSQQPALERMGVTLRDTAKLANVNVEIHSVPEDQYTTVKRQMSIGDFFARTTPDTMLYEWYHSTGSWNNMNFHFKNAEVDHILDAARQTSDVQEQKRLYTRFQEIAVNDGPGVVVFVVNHADGVGNRVHGFTASPLSVLNLKAVTVSN